MTISVPQLYRRASLPQQLQVAAVIGYAAVFVVLLSYPKAGVGIPQGFYLPILLASLSGGPGTGAVSGVIAAALYDAALRANGLGPTPAGAGVHLLLYAAAGLTVGYFARRARGMLAEALQLLDQMLHVARSDLTVDTGGLESAITRRIGANQPFGLLVGEVTSEGQDSALVLQAAGRAIELRAGDEVVVGEIGPTQLAVVVPAESPAALQREAAELEQLLERHGWRATFGWAARPTEGDDALSLCRAASERLYARHLAVGLEPAA